MGEPSFVRKKPRPPKKLTFDYKDVEQLQQFISPGGKIVASRTTRLNAKQQRDLARAVKRARHLALLPNGIY